MITKIIDYIVKVQQEKEIGIMDKKKWVLINSVVIDIGDTKPSLKIFYTELEKSCLLVFEHGDKTVELLSSSIDELIIQLEDNRKTLKALVDNTLDLEDGDVTEYIKVMNLFDLFVKDTVDCLSDFSKVSKNYCNLTSLMSDKKGVGEITLLKLEGVNKNGATAMLSWFAKQHQISIDEDTSLLLDPLVIIPIDGIVNINKFYTSLLKYLGTPNCLRESIEAKRQKVARVFKLRKTKVFIIKDFEAACDDNVKLLKEIDSSLSILASELNIKIVVLSR